jgi:hypothetical protein
LRGPPSAALHPTTRLCRGIFPDARQELARDVAVKGIMEGRDLAAPQADCPKACSGRGMCRRNPADPGKPATCMCYWGWDGDECEKVGAGIAGTCVLMVMVTMMVMVAERVAACVEG